MGNASTAGALCAGRKTSILIWPVVILALAAALLASSEAAWAQAEGDIGEAPGVSASAGEVNGQGRGLVAQELAPASVTRTAVERTPVEIREFFESHPFGISEPATYEVEPRRTAPYEAGRLSADSEQQALNALNVMRYIAGIPADVTLDGAYRSRAQAGALVNAANGSLEHTPAKPDDMDDELYQLGYEGDSSSNIAAGFSNPAATVLGYMDDGGDNNYGVAGHRMRILDSCMMKTGFGQVGRYSATYVFDSSGPDAYVDVAWPARNMPTCFFDATAAWSYVVDWGTFSDVENLKVTLTRNRDGKTWTFSSPATTVDMESDFFVSMALVGMDALCQKVLFYPDGIGAMQDGDVFDVSMSDGTATKSYSVTFFDLYKPMHRLYNPYTGEHFYTAGDTERDDVIEAGWRYEGIGWNAPVEGDPVYRLYNEWGGEHHYTPDADERRALLDAGWTDEGVGWMSAGTEGVPLYREYNPNMFSCNHNYTSDRSEHDSLVSIGWRDEGVAWYGVDGLE